jgi:2-keto-4-pentenoate hydratase/2-oxohepta-3-ene-1,7-dioic acid hydratase in catechol pathway
MLDIIRAGIDIDRIATDCIDQLRAEGRLKTYLVNGVKFLPPVLDPPKILALALNYPSHIAETNLDFFNEPIVFEKYPSTMIGHEAEIELPPFPQKVDEEHELAVVVGRDCRHVSPAEARAAVFGYTICNDVSARQRQGERFKMGQPYSYAKNFATFCPIGPWIVTAKELPDPRGLKQEVRINGKVRRKGNTKDMIFDPFEVIAYCSDYAPLQAGDVISLGTYAGDKDLHAGDTVELVTDKIGTLRNRVVKAPAPWPSFTAGKPTGPMVKGKAKARGR